MAQHASEVSVLPELLRAWTKHNVAFASQGDCLMNNKVYVSPPQRHLIVNPDATLTVSSKERVAFVRPSFNWLLESAAAAYGPRLAAILLSGSNGDGARGAARVARAGGLVLAQDPETCKHPEMPSSAWAARAVTARLPVSAIGPAVVEHARRGQRLATGAWEQPFATQH